MSKIVYNPVHNKKLQLLPASGESSYLVDTKANILATTATAGNAGFASDTLELFIGDGTNWQKSPLVFEQPVATSIGAIEYDGNSGYNKNTVSNKVLATTTIGDYTSTFIKEGSLRRNTDLDKVQVYLEGEWRNIVTMTQEKEDDVFYYSQERELSEQEVSGHMVMQFGRLDIGAIPSDYILDGGTL